MNAAPPSFVPGRRSRTAASVAIASLALLAIVVMANYLAATRKVWRVDLAAGDRPPLSPLTVQMLSALTNDVKVTVLFRARPGLFPHVDALLREYRSRSPRISVQTIDPEANPGTATLKKLQLKLGAKAGELVVFEANGRTQVVTDGELSIYNDGDVRARMEGQDTEIRRSAFTGEQRFTSAIAALMDATEVRAAYLTGHGEHALDSEDAQMGHAEFGRLLTGEKNLRLEKLNLATNDLPAETRLMVIAGPMAPFLPGELSRIEAYLRRGGRLLVTLNPYAVGTKTGLEDLLARWSVACPPMFAGEGDRHLVRTGLDVISLAQSFGSHPLMTPIRRDEGFLYFPMPRVVSPMPPGSLPAEAPKADVLVSTSESGLTRSSFRNGNAAFEPARDRKDLAVPIVVAAERGGVSGVAAGRGATRLIVVGDSVLFGNQTLAQGSNRDFASLCVAWLLDRPQSLAIGPKPLREWRLNLSESTLSRLRWILLAGLPGSVLLLGVIVWARRRS